MWRRSGVLALLLIVSVTAGFGAEATLLAPEAISTADHGEYGLALSPDGNTAYFTRDRDIYTSSRVDGAWTAATRLPFCSPFFDGDPFVAPEGRRLFFMSSRVGSKAPADTPAEKRRADVWVADRLADGSFGPPRNIGRPVNTDAMEGHASVAANGTLYYFSEHAGGMGGHDIYRSVPTDAGYGTYENIGPPVNSVESDGHPYIAPDESFIVFYSNRAGGYGSCDLYVSFREGRRWSEPRNLGPEINTADCEMTPHVSPDGASLYFARIDEDGGRDLFVIDFSARGRQAKDR